jgi:hypothetical protein
LRWQTTRAVTVVAVAFVEDLVTAEDEDVVETVVNVGVVVLAETEAVDAAAVRVTRGNGSLSPNWVAW